jgi:signal transduction histidine kinase
MHSRWTPLRVMRRLGHRRTTVRQRLTLLYGGLFFACGAALLAITYLLVDRTFPRVNQKTPVPGGPQSRPVTHGGRPPRPLSPGATAALDAQRADLHRLLVVSAIALAVMVIVSLALGWVVAGRVLRPLRTITATTRQISEDNLHQRLALDGPPDELKDLSDTIDELLARLDSAFEAQRRFAANVSHELRTPLTVGRTLLEMILGDPDASAESFRTVCQDVLEAGNQQEQLIEALLILARSQRGLDQRQSFDLAVIATDVAHAREPTAAANGLRLDISAGSALVSGDPQLTRRLVANLVDNAVRHNLPGGNVQLLVDTQAGQARLTVTNTGPHVPPDQVARLLEPFQRMATDRAGHHDGLGLGLSIVAAIANSHDATLHAQPRAAGGLEIQVTFPAAPRSPQQRRTS